MLNGVRTGPGLASTSLSSHPFRTQAEPGALSTYWAVAGSWAKRPITAVRVEVLEKTQTASVDEWLKARYF